MPDSSDQELAIFSDARHLPPEQCAAFLDTACGGDAALRRRVEQLLQTADESKSFMETPAGELLTPGEFLRPAIPAEKPGDRIGRYELLEQIGEGGCGIVYKASQEQPVRRLVALKIIKLGMDTKSVISRFEAERQALALMDHPNIAKVLDAGATDNGRPYFVMELVDGVKITDFCDENNLSTRERLELFIDVCRAVQHAHQKGIIHRDLKPSNILVKMSDDVPLPKIIDFGIAKATRGKLTDETFFTALEQFIGTPAYMSPEQADARETDIDTRSDIYSLGVLLYELLTGRTPFDAKELLQSGLDGIRHTIREQEPAAPSTRLTTMQGADLALIAKHRSADTPQLIHQVRGDLDWIVMKALEKDRARRYETTNGLALDIQRHLDNEPVLACPPSPLYQFQKLVRRNRIVFAAGASIALALTIGVAISIRATLKEHQALIEADNQRSQAEANAQKAEAAQEKAEAAQSAAEVDEKKAETEAAKSRQVAQFLEDMLNGVSPSVAMGADTTLLKKILDNTSKQIGTSLTNEPDVEAELHDTLGQVYWAIGDMTNAEAMDRRALEIRSQASDTNTPEVAESMEHLSHVLWREGKLAEAERVAQAGILLQINIYGVTNLAVARSLEDYAAILNTRGFAARSASALRQALAIKETLLGRESLEVADTMDDLGGMLLSAHSNMSQGQNLEREALATRKKILGTNNPVFIIDALTLDKIEEDAQGRSADEEATLNKIIAAQRQFYGGPHPDLAQSLNMLASVLKNEGKLADSETARREALDMQRRLLGPDSAEVAQTLMYLGDLLVAENKFADAQPMLTTAYNLRRKIFGDGSALTATALVDLGTLYEAEGKTDAATNLYLSQAGGPPASAAAADYRLGLMYVYGKGVPPDPALGIKWVYQSAKLGHTDAQIEMGVLFFYGTGFPKNETNALWWFERAANGGSTGIKSATLKTLAGCYCTVGRGSNAIAVLQKIIESNPSDLDAWMTLAALQAWYGEDAAYESTRRDIIQLATAKADASVAGMCAKVYCLEPSTNLALLDKSLELIQHAQSLYLNTVWVPWYQLRLGMAQYRLGRFAEAEQTFNLAEQTAGRFQDIPPAARFYRALCIFKQGRAAEARQLFTQTEAQMTPYPQDPDKPVVGDKAASHDVIVTWLAYREAKSLIFGAESN